MLNSGQPGPSAPEPSTMRPMEFSADTRNAHLLEAWRHFLVTPLAETLARHHTQVPAVHAAALLARAARDVPAYRAFLSQQSTPTDNPPLTTKANYLRAYPLAELCWHGDLSASEMIHCSSGSTGKPLFWPRNLVHELDITARFEQVFRDAFAAHERSTLAIVCFALGTWVGGFYTAQCCRYLAQKGYRITLVTPGNNKDEILRVVQELGPLFEQMVLIGYPPFIKDVVDSGCARGVEWPSGRVRMMYAGEVYSEEWRDLMCARVGSHAPEYDTASLYGTADAGVLGNETPLSIVIRRYFSANPQAARAAFGESRLPTLVQYDPLSRYFEVHEGTLVVSGDSTVPLLRYHIADQGGVFSFAQMRAQVENTGGDWAALTQGLRVLRDLPFVYLFGRADFTVSYFGANIYPENISVGLEQPHISPQVTGKFVLAVGETSAQDWFLSLAVELSAGAQPPPDFAAQVSAAVLAQLRRLNSEFAHYVPPEHQRLQLTLLPLGDPEYFPVGLAKHRYTRR